MTDEAYAGVMANLPNDSEGAGSHGLHLFTVGGRRQYLAIRCGRIEAAEHIAPLLVFGVFFGLADEGISRSLTRDEFNHIVDLGADGAAEDWAILNATYLFPSDQFESTLAKLPGADRKMRVDWGLKDEPTLVRSALRFTSPDGTDDILVDWAPGPLRVQLRLRWSRLPGHAALGDEFRRITEVAMQFVDKKAAEPTTEGGDDDPAG